MNSNPLKTLTFDVQIPNLDGDGIAATIPIEVLARLDPETGEDVLTSESLDLIEKTQARHMGLMSAEEIKALRERLDLTQKEMSALLQTGEKSYTRWESGRSRPSRSINVLLCTLRDGQVDVNYLRALRDPTARWASASREWTRLDAWQLSNAVGKTEIVRKLQSSFQDWLELAEELGSWISTTPDMGLQTGSKGTFPPRLRFAGPPIWLPQPKAEASEPASPRRPTAAQSQGDVQIPFTITDPDADLAGEG